MMTKGRGPERFVPYKIAQQNLGIRNTMKTNFFRSKIVH